MPMLYHIKHLEKSACDHVEWVLVKWSPSTNDDGQDMYEDDPIEFMNTMLEHKFGINVPEHVFSFVSRRICSEPLATPLNLCIGNHEDE